MVRIWPISKSGEGSLDINERSGEGALEGGGCVTGIGLFRKKTSVRIEDR